MERMYANLHLHSTHSDGVYSPRELVSVAKEEGYRALAITDHDTASAYGELKEAADAAGMECLFGVEFSVVAPYDFHIVGFSFDPDFPEMRDYLEKMALRQTDNTKHCFDAAVARGGIGGITWEEVLEYNRGIPWLCNNHVFRAMRAKGLLREEDYMAWFKTNFTYTLRKQYPALYPYKDLFEITDLVRRAGGFTICAHPKGRHLDKIDLLLASGVEGLEVHHADLTPEERARSLALAMEKGLFVSGGSDHSGLCGGLYGSYATREALEASHHFIPPLSAGVTERHFRELQTRRLER